MELSKNVKDHGIARKNRDTGATEELGEQKNAIE